MSDLCYLGKTRLASIQLVLSERKVHVRDYYNVMAYSHCTGTGPVQVQGMAAGAVGTNMLQENVQTGPRRKEPRPVAKVQTSNPKRDRGDCSATVRSQTEKFKLQILKEMGGGHSTTVTNQTDKLKHQILKERGGGSSKTEYHGVLKAF